MAKYSYNFKKNVVMDYLAGEASYQGLSKIYNIPDKRIIKTWVDNYLKFGDDGLTRSRRQRKYSFTYKLSVVECYLAGDLSYQDLALQEGIHNPALICRWVNEFHTGGPNALRPKRKGRKKSLDKLKMIDNANLPQEKHSDDSNEYIKRLENELLKLKIENAYLKELRRLRLEEEALLKKKRESYTASEENSN